MPMGQRLLDLLGGYPSSQHRDRKHDNDEEQINLGDVIHEEVNGFRYQAPLWQAQKRIGKPVGE